MLCVVFFRLSLALSGPDVESLKEDTSNWELTIKRDSIPSATGSNQSVSRVDTKTYFYISTLDSIKKVLKTKN